MIDLDATFFVQLANFIITLVGLNLLLFRPIRTIIKDRAAALAGMASEVEAFTKNADEKVKNYEAVLAEARANGVAARMQLKDEASKAEKALLDAAAKEAQDDLSAARKDVSGQAEAAMLALKAQVGVLAEKAAQKILG